MSQSKSGVRGSFSLVCHMMIIHLSLSATMLNYQAREERGIEGLGFTLSTAIYYTCICPAGVPVVCAMYGKVGCGRESNPLIFQCFNA